MRSKKNGFTLIELLAVIVILAIIAIIATPQLLKVIETAKQGSAEASAHGYVEVVEYNISLGEVGKNGYSKIESGTYQVSDFNFKMKGKAPSNGIIEISNNKVEEATLCVGGYNIYYDGLNSTTIGKCDTTQTEILYEEAILNGAIPTLKSDMIPVTIDNDGKVKKADLYTRWYTYRNKKWANAVVLIDNTSYDVGDVIPEEKIKAYYVWIPRYKYQLFDSTTPIEIQIIFENKDVNKSNSTTIGEYHTHPAFTYGTEELNGFWVGKFETTGTDVSPTIKPNLSSIGYQNVSSQYTTSLLISTNSRMMKNDEWGAVAYLSHSKYGINGEVRINNNSSHKTGCGANVANSEKTSACEIAYGNAISYPQSTTGNIDGIFDMSGGSYETMLAVRADSSGNPYSGRHNVGNSGFNGKFADPDSSSSETDGDPTITELTTGIDFPDAKNYNLYYNPNGTSINGDNGCNGNKCYGHALTETKNWYGVSYSFPVKYPWLVRSRSYNGGSSAGLFWLGNYGGSGAYSNYTFRTVVQ